MVKLNTPKSAVRIYGSELIGDRFVLSVIETRYKQVGNFMQKKIEIFPYDSRVYVVRP